MAEIDTKKEGRSLRNMDSTKMIEDRQSTIGLDRQFCNLIQREEEIPKMKKRKCQLDKQIAKELIIIKVNISILYLLFPLIKLIKK